MRLTPQQQQHIVSLVREKIGPEARVSLFGSRLRAEKRGGDVDLIVEAPHRVPLLKKAALQLALESATSLPADILFIQTGRSLTPFQAMAKADSQPLERHTT